MITNTIVVVFPHGGKKEFPNSYVSVSRRLTLRIHNAETKRIIARYSEYSWHDFYNKAVCSDEK